MSEQYAGVVIKGTFDSNGMPTGWHIDGASVPAQFFLAIEEGSTNVILSLCDDGRVLHLGNEVPEWTRERREAMGLRIH